MPSDGTERRVVISASREVVIDTPRIEEYVRANFEDGDQVQIQDVGNGEMYYDNIGCRSLFPEGDR